MHINKMNSHVISIGFEYHAPATLDEAAKLLERYGREAKILAGGTDLIPQIKQRKAEPRHVVNIKRIPVLARVQETKGGISIGASARLRAIELSPLLNERLPLLVEAAKSVGSVQIRNMATIGGNICNASPSADMATALLALDAEAHVYGKGGAKSYPIEEFFRGGGEVRLDPSEMLTGMTVPLLPEGAGSAFEKVGWTTFDVATVNVAAVVTLKEGRIDICRVALGACSPAPMRVTQAEEYLKGRKPTDGELSEVAAYVSTCVEPRERWRRAPPEYRRRTSMALAMDAISRAVEAAEG